MSPKLSPLVKLNNGKEIPLVGLGTWKSPAGQVYEAVKIAVEAGYRHIDCAYVYGNEDEVGRALAELFQAGTVKREDLFITSKCWNSFHSRPLVPQCLNLSLKNLGLDYLDLYLVHWPMGVQEGGESFPKNEKGEMIFSEVDYLDTWRGMEDCAKSGKVKSIGLSNFNSKQIERILENAEIKPVVNQVECHPYLNQKKLIDFCSKRGILITAYSPLGSPDRPWAKPGDPLLLDEPRIQEIAKKYNKSAAQVLIKFQAQRGVVVIPKSVTKERIIANFQLFDFELSPQDMATIESFDKDFRFLGVEWNAKHIHYPFNIPF